MSDAPIWIIDDGPFNALADHVALEVVATWPRSTYWVPEATGQASAQSPRRLELLREPSRIQTLTIMMGTPAEEILYEHLNQDPASTKNLAENQAIAWILTQPTTQDLVFVAEDKRALSVALAELGRGRVAHSFDLWRHLLERKHVDEAVFQALCHRTCKRDQSLPGLPWSLRERRSA